MDEDFSKKVNRSAKKLMSLIVTILILMDSRLVTTPVLAYPDFTKEFILDTDASNMAIGIVLSQNGCDQQEHIIANSY